ncbi:oligosaccharide flippase family protein [Carnobacteriaceae bacterium zg-ZUI240]|nr:oligosaccharide flippase family protein [Carnobacteriaceae bacterium zg-ZUI240]
MKKSNILKSGFLYTLGTVFIQGISFITLPIYTRVISPEAFGQYSLYAAYLAMIGLVIGLQTSGSLSAAKITYQEDEYDRYAVTALSVSLLFAIILTVLGIAGRNVLAHWLNVSAESVVLLFIQSTCIYVTTFLGTYFIQLQKSLLNLVLSLFSAIVGVALSLTLIYLWEDHFAARVYGAGIPTVLTAAFALIYFYRKKVPVLTKSYVPFILSVSLPLIFHQLGHQILNQMDRVMIANAMQISDVAIYSFGYSMGLIIQIVLMSMNTVWVPWYFKEKKAANVHLQKHFKKYIFLGLFLTLGYLTIYPEFALLMGGEKYSQSIHFIALIILSYFFVFLYTIPVNVQFYHANTKMIPVGTLLSGGINIVLNIVMIATMGIYGAALATLLSYFALLIFHYMISKRKYNDTEFSIQFYGLLAGISLGYAELMNLFLNNILVRYLVGAVVVIIYSLYYKNELFALINKIKNKK